MSITSLYRRNVGGFDRAARTILGALLIAAGLFLAGGARGQPFGIMVALAGLVFLVTGITGRCPLYVPFGISTARRGATARSACCGRGEEPTHQRSEQPACSARASGR